MTSLALCALCWTLLSSGACPDSSIRDKAFCTVVSLAPPRSPSRYCSSTKNLSSGIWGLCINHIVRIFFILKFSVKGSQFMFNTASYLFKVKDMLQQPRLSGLLELPLCVVFSPAAKTSASCGCWLVKEMLKKKTCQLLHYIFGHLFIHFVIRCVVLHVRRSHQVR